MAKKTYKRSRRTNKFLEETSKKRKGENARLYEKVRENTARYRNKRKKGGV